MAYNGYSNGLFIFNEEELRELIRGDTKWVKCLFCDNNGTEYWDGHTGQGASANPSNIDPSKLASGPCGNCHGLGFLIG